MGTASAIAQGNSLGFLARTPAAKFDSTDWSLLKGAVKDVLNAQEQEAARAWRNDANGHGGHVRVVKNYKDEDGRQCKQLQMDNSAGGYKNSSVVSACRDTDGNWRATDGTPLTFSAVHRGSMLPVRTDASGRQHGAQRMGAACACVQSSPHLQSPWH
jgi:surface antigen